jgi:hypothetical protein
MMGLEGRRVAEKPVVQRRRGVGRKGRRGSSRLGQYNARFISDIVSLCPRNFHGMKYESVSVGGAICGADGRGTASTLGQR